MLIIEKTVYFKIIIQSVCVHLEVYYNALGPRFATHERAGGGGGGAKHCRVVEWMSDTLSTCFCNHS